MEESLSLVAKHHVHLPSTGKFSRSKQTYREGSDEKGARGSGNMGGTQRNSFPLTARFRPRSPARWLQKKEITAIPAVMAKIGGGTSKPESFTSSIIQVVTCLLVQHRWRGRPVVSSSWDSKATPGCPELALWKCR